MRLAILIGILATGCIHPEIESLHWRIGYLQREIRVTQCEVKELHCIREKADPVKCKALLQHCIIRIYEP